MKRTKIKWPRTSFLASYYTVTCSSLLQLIMWAVCGTICLNAHKPRRYRQIDAFPTHCVRPPSNTGLTCSSFWSIFRLEKVEYIDNTYSLIQWERLIKEVIQMGNIYIVDKLKELKNTVLRMQLLALPCTYMSSLPMKLMTRTWLLSIIGSGHGISAVFSLWYYNK